MDKYWLVFYHGMVHWTGSDYGSAYGRFEPYDAISGFASLGVVSTVVVAYRHFFCAQKHCWRMGKHAFTDPKDNVTHKLCWKHHPDVKYKELDHHSIGIIHHRRLAVRNGGKVA